MIVGKYPENFCLAPLALMSSIFFYISPLNYLNLVLAPGAKLEGHRGTWAGCFTAW